MPSSSEFHIFRDSRRRTSTPAIVETLRKTLGNLASRGSLDLLLSLLLLAGELECALSDATAPGETCERASRLTDLLADAAIGADLGTQLDSRQIKEAAGFLLDDIQFCGALGVSVPEGFAYYALHPLDYADLVARSKIESRTAVVVGIRSIGTSISAVVAAKLRSQGCTSRAVRGDQAVQRFTVRPTGHPYDRHCDFDPAQRSTIVKGLAEGATFLVCDEGPGRSGSSLLSVAEALEREGVPPSRIAIVCAYDPDPEALCARDAPQRWSRYRVAATGMTQRLPAEAAEYLGSGEWRNKLFPRSEAWPAVWPQMEQLRYGSADGTSLLTFEGHGPYGASVRDRQQALSDAGFSPRYLGQEAGFGRHKLARGTIARPEDISPGLLAHMAQYCAWRAREFAVADSDVSQIETMARVNYEREFGTERDDLVLPIERPTVCDSRMMPHAWLRVDGDRWVKLDAAIHGDDHFFPGPCDIAWDLAGVIVEWNLQPEAREVFLAEYRKASADDPAHRIAAYEFAYATFRMAWSAMAAGSVRRTEEELRLMCDYKRYNNFLRACDARSLEHHALTHAVRVG